MNDGSTTIYPRNKKQLTALKAIFEEMKVPFEKSKVEAGDEDEIKRLSQASPYNADFEAKMKRAAEDKKAGRYKAIKTADLWK